MKALGYHLMLQYEEHRVDDEMGVFHLPGEVREY